MNPTLSVRAVLFALALAQVLTGVSWCRAQSATAMDGIAGERIPGRLELPRGGVIWATEDPTLGVPQLAITSPGMVAFDGRAIAEPVRFMVRSNYTAFMSRMEVRIYRASDGDRVLPLVVLPVPVVPVSEVTWDGDLPSEVPLRYGDELIYVLRAYAAPEAYAAQYGGTLSQHYAQLQSIYDETVPESIQLVRSNEAERQRQRVRRQGEFDLARQLSGQQAQTQSMLNEVFRGSGLRQQNIPVYGSRVRILGSDIPPDRSLLINHQPYPVDMNNQFAAEFLLPIGHHQFDIGLQGPGGYEQYTLDIPVSGRYFFGVAMADITIAKSDIDGSRATFEGDDRFDDDDDILQEGRLAFYLKGKAQGKYLLTAQMDTTEKALDNLFSDFSEAYPSDIFRRLDPDYYYPTYGDDSTTFRDVDTQGRFYLRADWDKNQVLWGNYTTGLTGTDLAMFVRSLYGAAGSWYSRSINLWGDPLSEVRIFGSQAETAPGHNEFLGTGGSLYYLRETDILPGSDRVALEIRDITTGRVEARIDLQRGVDYEIDELQGRIILTRPLTQITRANVPTLSRDVPLDGYEQRLIVDYEWVPTDWDDDNLTSGARVKQWMGDYVGLGGTYADESRSGDDYRLAAGDLTLQGGEGTYLKLEYASSDSYSAPSYFSDNGGFNFALTNADLVDDDYTSGDARLVEGRINLQELGWSQSPWTAAAWWRDMDPGYSANRYNSGRAMTEYGGELLGDIYTNLNLYLRYSEAESGEESFEQAQATVSWGVDDTNSLSSELRYVDEQSMYSDGSAILAALQYTHRMNTFLDVYGLVQGSFDESEGYDSNNLMGIGGRWLYGNSASVGAEYTHGDRGEGLTVDGDYRVNADYSIYAGYNYSTDSTERNTIFNPRVNGGWTVGQRWRLSNQVNLFNENTFLKEPNRSGIAHTVGLDFFPSAGWNLGVTVQSGTLVDIFSGDVERRAVSIAGGRRSPASDWQSKIEWRQDRGFERREQWVSTNSISHKINESWRIAGRVNVSDTDDLTLGVGGARFVEGNMGFAWRPWDNTRWAAFGRLTYLYDLATLGQRGGADYDQRTRVMSFEGIRQLGSDWELSLKLARREGDVRLGRGSGPWVDSASSFSASQLRYDFGLFHALVEYRWLDVESGGSRDGFLVGYDWDIAEYFRMGVGYNFTDFSDDLTDFDYDHNGWYVNFVGAY
ncbi:hypothetical protein ACONUD_19455 [Microbulbifer harenosus]|uniref:Uncharacterized protein n=1 Tax=Microbulbifer harenosus TaxID=2576840 RepID=A0ABY2UDF3_9GAMM|nr:hypothetical protein [Microbulbifer harenosus]TLM74434.1 hypothetical protein FDY93_17450 [Microbulbifer harenosus]